MKNLVQKNLNKKIGAGYVPGTRTHQAYLNGYNAYMMGASPANSSQYTGEMRDAWEDGYYSAKHAYDVDENM